MQGMEEEFRFLLCGKCQREAQNPKLLACLHTLCSECIQESKPVGHCPVCQVAVPVSQDNLLFTHLQANLNTYRKIVAGEGLVCSRCKGEAEFWCSECEVFLCTRCFEDHQWHLKRKSHEARKIDDVRADSATAFLAAVRKSCTLFCSNPTHNNQGQIANLYCCQCRKPLCCSCALLAPCNKHSYCDISKEIEQRKEELNGMSQELWEKEQCYGQTHGDLQQRVQEMESVRNETRALIEEKVEEMVRQIREKGDQLLDEVDKQLHKERQDTQAKLQAMESALHRMKTGTQLVEKMVSFASDQVVMDMYPFIRESLDELKKERVPMAGLRVQTRNFAEVKDQLQALCKKVMGQKDPAVASHVPSTSVALNTEAPRNEINHPKAQGSQMPTYTLSIEKSPYGFTPSMTTPRKRPLNLCEKSIQASPKTLKHESPKSQEGETSTRHIQEVATCSQCAFEMTPERDRRVVICSGDADHSPPEICESEVASIVISSSEDSNAETMYEATSGSSRGSDLCSLEVQV
ncbi:PREDICTED: protein PML-like [Gekko japonicus]|uniref:Protein PML-like n=1 Tax=Gekko japonicus TaxID=146911 RepID=A0ABM1JUT1_GEKJA|nr:PREDICTED: protein PML-like [Gekko japonicus]